MTQINVAEHVEIARFSEPDGIRPRGTVLVVAGRGESAGVYTRFGTRIAADGYRVVVASAPAPADPAIQAELAALTRPTPEDDRPAPVVLVGSDTGAWAALRLAADPAATVDAVVLAGLPVHDAEPTDWPDEVALRTACPVHQGTLRRSAQSLAFSPVSVPSLVTTVSPPAVPVLALHGSDDRIAPLRDAVARYQSIGADLRVVQGGRHDILNDVTHRSVAATVVLFLESLRLGPELPAIVSPQHPRAAA